MSEVTAQLPDPFDDPAIRAFAETAWRLYASEDLDDTLLRISTTVVDTIDGCDLASISLLEGDMVVTRGATHELAAHIDGIQYELGEGPCLDAASTERFVYTADTGSDGRWPRFSERVRGESGVGSMMSFRLAVHDDTHRSLGSINVYSRRIDAFGRDDQALLALIAAHAGAVVDASVHEANLRLALESRQTIGMAVGILMEGSRSPPTRPSTSSGRRPNASTSSCARSPSASPRPGRAPTSSSDRRSCPTAGAPS